MFMAQLWGEFMVTGTVFDAAMGELLGGEPSEEYGLLRSLRCGGSAP